jgi:hypothetical protein
MKDRTRLNIAVLSAFVAAFLVAATLLAVPAAFAASQTDPPGCFSFTSNGSTVGTVICNPNANDLTVYFKPGPNCIVIFGTASMPCPKGANNIDFNWTVTASAGPMITGCVWTKGNVKLTSLPCIVPPGTTTFKIMNIMGATATIVKVVWTLNGKPIGKAVKPPAGVVVNDVEFNFG